MALQKEFTLSSGYVANYVKISSLRQDKLNISLQIDLYKDATARNAGKSPAVSNFAAKSVANLQYPNYSFVLTQEQFDDGDVYGYAYDYLKSLPIFSGADDV